MFPLLAICSLKIDREVRYKASLYGEKYPFPSYSYLQHEACMHCPNKD